MTTKLAQLLSGKWHVGALAILGIYLVVLPLLGVQVPAKAELIGGNYTNVISAIAAGLASGIGVSVAKSHKSMRQEIGELRALLHPKTQSGVESPSQGESPAGNE